jgi:hypothetical protein
VRALKEAMKLKSVNSSCTVMMHRKYLEEDIEGLVAVVFAAAASDGVAHQNHATRVMGHMGKTGGK